MAIPKILHYCWFGGGEMPKTEASCVKGWSRFFGDYKIMLWNESNFDIHCNKYVEEAYAAKRFSYVADVARLSALYRFGGVYLDADCKVLKSFDPLLDCHAFTGFGADNRELAACTLAFEAGDPFIKECLDSYETDSFLLPDGTPNTRSINLRMTAILEQYGFVQNGEKQTVRDIVIYPMTYFCPLSMLPDTVPDCKSKNTYSMALWTSKELRRERSFLIRFAHKTGLNKLVRKVLRR
ncbi:MAG: glycosyl transferase [Clostridia bacterium]|nr:glycosyl transferase [Clostridia bacterium]